MSSTTVYGLCLLLEFLPYVALEVEGIMKSFSCCFFPCPHLFPISLYPQFLCVVGRGWGGGRGGGGI